MSVQVIHPVKSQPRGTSPVAWVLLVLFLLGALGGGGYYIYVHNIYKRMQSAPPVATPPAQPAPSTVTTAPATQPSVTTPEATPSGGTTTAPTQPPGSTTPPTTAENKPPIEAPTAKPEPPKREAEASGGVTVPTPGGSGRSAPAPKIGQLIVTSNIPGARISIDGRSEADWVTPRTISDVPVGTHAVVITKEGYGNVQQSVTIEAGKTKPISVNLAAPSGEVTLETVPPGYEVIIDGKSYGASPVRATLAVGKHPFQIPRPGLPPYESSFEIKYDGHMFKRTVDLGRPVTPTGIVEVRTIPPGATVLADGAPVGAPTPTSFRMAAGQHSLVISLSGHPQVQRTVDVTADGTSVVRVDLTGQ